MTSKSSIILVFLLFCKCYAFSQTAAKVNEAELLICENKFEEAAEIYDELLSQKQNLLSPDYYNAALCHIKSDNFQAAKKHLNKLAQMGINPGELLVHANLANSIDWESYMITYNQFYEYAEKNNKYTQFELEMTELKAKIEDLEKRKSIRFLQQNATLHVLFDNQIAKVVEIDSIQNNRIFDLYNTVRDSLILTDKYSTFKSKKHELKAKYFFDFTNFVKENSWPSEIELNRNSLDQEANSFLQMAAYFFRAGPTIEVNYLGKEAITFQYSSRLDSSVVDSSISEIRRSLNAACQAGKIKSSTVLKMFYPKVYEKYVNVKAISIFVNESGCNEFGDKLYIEPLVQESTEKSLPPNLESREDMGKKYLFVIKNPDLFILGVQAQVEQAHYGSCESARQYIKSKKLFALN